MRLQVAILRHDLPTVRLIYNTASKHGPGAVRIVTVADFLSAINALVPLESADSEWGLEDYVVEVAATADQSQPYECFHFQDIKDVLKEDDEVVIRGLSNEELRERKQGGRLQITSDGRHLIDGLSWGRRWRAGVSAGRPDIMIPPRKRRRIMLEPEFDEEARLELEYPPGRELVQFAPGSEGFADEDEDEDEEDGDYEDYEEEDEEDQESEEEDEEIKQESHNQGDRTLSSSPKQVVTRVRFEDADSNGDDDDDDEMDEDYNEDLSEGAEDFTAELNALTAEAGATKVDPEQPRITRRRRVASQEASSSQTNATSKDFSSPRRKPQVNGLGGIDNTKMSTTDNAVKAAQDYIAASGNLSNDDVAATTGMLSLERGVAVPKNGQGDSKLALVNGHNSATSSSSEESSDEDSDDTSSSGGPEDEASTEGSDSDSDEEASSKGSKERTFPREPDRDSDNGSDSSDSTSSSDSSHESTHASQKPASSTNLGKNIEGLPIEQSTDGPKNLPHANKAPGTGQNKTRRNNERKKMSKLLANLKEEGKLHQDADFQALRQYLAETAAQEEPQDEAQVDEPPPPSTQERIAARKEELLAPLNGTEHTAVQIPHETEAASITVQSHKDHTDSGSLTSKPSSEQFEVNVNTYAQPEPTTNIMAQTSATIGPMSQTPQMNPDEASPKRARLDVAASRRMLFNSLGVRNPKTAEAENALRDKLAKPVRQITSKAIAPTEEVRPKAPLAADRWKQKFTVLAVECIQDWKTLDTPPFPFKQPWQIRQERTQMAKSNKQQERYEETLNYDEIEEDQDSQPMDTDYTPAEDLPSQSLTTSRTLTAGTTIEDVDYPEPSDFSIWPALTQSNLSEASFIAYKELQMNARSEPEQSSYRVAKVISAQDNRMILKLAPRYREAANGRYDETTGERQYSRFEAPDGENEEDEEPDDGVRNIDFSEMIHPKIVAMSYSAKKDNLSKPQAGEQIKINGKATLRGGHLDNAVRHFSHTLENNPTVSTPRRKEISDLMKEAGFESAVGDQLLQGLVTAVQDKTSTPNEDEYMADVDDTQRTTQRSSPIRPTSITPVSAILRESSVASESMVESVRYPQLSELDPGTPMPAQSSSHQDAQQAISTPILPPEDTTNLTTTLPESANALQIEPDSLPSEVPQTQSQDLIPDSLHAKLSHNADDKDIVSPIPDTNHTSITTKPEKQTTKTLSDQDNKEITDTIDGALLNEDDAESVDSNGFPSLDSLTSSQRRKQTKSSSKQHLNQSLSQQPSDPTPYRRSPRVHNSILAASTTTTVKPTARSSDWSDTDEPPQSQSRSNSDSQNHTQSAFKASQSQRRELAEIPEDTIVVDLTQSSPADSPHKDKGKGKAKERETQTSASNPRKSTGNGPPIGVFKRSFQGLGEKSFLKKKKRSL